MTPDQESARIKRLVSAASSVLSLEVGLAVGAFRVHGRLCVLGEIYTARHPSFGEFITDLPPGIFVGRARLECAPAFFWEQENILARVESKHRKSLLEDCMRIISRYGPNNSSKPTPLRGAA